MLPHFDKSGHTDPYKETLRKKLCESIKTFYIFLGHEKGFYKFWFQNSDIDNYCFIKFGILGPILQSLFIVTHIGHKITARCMVQGVLIVAPAKQEGLVPYQLDSANLEEQTNFVRKIMVQNVGIIL